MITSSNAADRQVVLDKVRRYFLAGARPSVPRHHHHRHFASIDAATGTSFEDFRLAAASCTAFGYHSPAVLDQTEAATAGYSVATFASFFAVAAASSSAD